MQPIYTESILVWLVWTESLLYTRMFKLIHFQLWHLYIFISVVLQNLTFVNLKLLVRPLVPCIHNLNEGSILRAGLLTLTLHGKITTRDENHLLLVGVRVCVKMHLSKDDHNRGEKYYLYSLEVTQI